MSSIAKFKDEIMSKYPENPKLVFSLGQAFDGIIAGLKELESAGYSFDLIEAEPKVPEEYPKMFYHPGIGQLIVSSQEEAEALGPNWQDRPFGDQTVVEPQPEPEASPAPVAVDIAALFAGQAAVEQPAPTNLPSEQNNGQTV